MSLQRDIAVELGVGGLPDLPHAAFADEGGHVVVPEAVTDGQWHQSLGPELAQVMVGVEVPPSQPLVG